MPAGDNHPGLSRGVLSNRVGWRVNRVGTGQGL